MNNTTIPCDNIQTPTSIVVSVLEHDIELTFAELEDTSLFDRLRQTLFQTYIQTLAYPH
jgi:hypothetical protein